MDESELAEHYRRAKRELWKAQVSEARGTYNNMVFLDFVMLYGGLGWFWLGGMSLDTWWLNVLQIVGIVSIIISMVETTNTRAANIETLDKYLGVCNDPDDKSQQHLADRADEKSKRHFVRARLTAGIGWSAMALYIAGSVLILWIDGS